MSRAKTASPISRPERPTVMPPSLKVDFRDVPAPMRRLELLREPLPPALPAVEEEDDDGFT